MSRQKQIITAIIYDKKGRVLSIGQNDYEKTHPMMFKYGKQVGMPERIYLHAEIAAITRCIDMKKAHRMLITRFTKDGKPALAKPCPICESAIKATKIQIVDYTA
jgi:tRNA(Arg) A34 adenosine deaminase TadA